MKSMLIVLAAASFAVQADTIARQGDDWVRFSEKPCMNAAILANPLVNAPENWRSATAFFQGKHYEACWQETGYSRHLVYEDGDQGIVPAHEVKPVPEA